ncbi:Y4yA family PLP-dependent enzyme [Nocardia puris]|uniref:Y4yA family PLP-dependent enzyme n=1 Tax=Nocardia puris TaxID=208602 RepID=UPI002B4AD4B8|nr:Y4yA family PLP-dependent enzyme [Nocardia puris]
MGLEVAADNVAEPVDPDAMMLFDIDPPRQVRGGSAAPSDRDDPLLEFAPVPCPFDAPAPPAPGNRDDSTSNASPMDVALPLPELEHVAPQVIAPEPASATPDRARPHTDTPPPRTIGTAPEDNDTPAPERGGVSEHEHAETSADQTPTASDDSPLLELAAEEIAAETAPHGITAPALPAHLDEWERRVLADPDLLADIAYAVGGPFHLMYPARVGQNIRAFRDAFAAAGVDGVVYYGKKANKAACVARACAENGAGIDVSSVGELTSALAGGVRGEDLVVTGPAKARELLWLAVRHGALLAVDDLDELDRLAELATAALPARVLLRVLPPGSASRFGMSAEELDAAQAVIAASGPVGLEPIRLEGFSFHLSGYDAVARAELAAELIDRCVSAREYGHPVTTLSIGGGFGVDYVPKDAWEEFTEGVDRAWFHAGKSFGSYYPYHFPTPGAAMLAEILAHNDLATKLRDNDIRLAVEPGRALLDRAGSTVFRVQGVRTRRAHGAPYDLLTVDGSSLSLSEQWFDSEYLPDPVLWPRRPGTPTPTSVGAASCLESDMLSWRRIPLPRAAAVGDLLVYPNTAGYQMDSNESGFHELPIPPKVVLAEEPGGRRRWSLDAR